MMSAGRRILIVDTDAGIDDAMALCMAFHAHKRGDVKVGRMSSNKLQLSLEGSAKRWGLGCVLFVVQVAAVTCVTGNTHVDNVLVNVLRTADLMGCGDVPVFRGAEEPLVHR